MTLKTAAKFLVGIAVLDLTLTTARIVKVWPAFLSELSGLVAG